VTAAVHFSKAHVSFLWLVRGGRRLVRGFDAASHAQAFTEEVLQPLHLSDLGSVAKMNRLRLQVARPPPTIFARYPIFPFHHAFPKIEGCIAINAAPRPEPQLFRFVENQA